MYEQGRYCGVPAHQQNAPAIILIWAAEISHRCRISYCLLLQVPGLTALGNSSCGIKYSQTIPNVKCIMKNTWEAWGENMIKNLGFPFFPFMQGILHEALDPGCVFAQNKVFAYCNGLQRVVMWWDFCYNYSYYFGLNIRIPIQGNIISV